MYNNILSENSNPDGSGVVQIITINREDKLNALNIELIQEIGIEVARLNKEKSVRGIIITGKGTKAFAAGADISEFANFGETEAKEMSSKGGAVFTSIEESEIPVIAAVNGYALGGGCELTMSCHVRIASENALFGQPEVNLGVPPGYGGTQRLAQIIGKGRAMDMLITAKSINAETALDFGLVTQLVAIEDLLPTCIKYVEKLIGKSPMAIAEVIKCTNALYKNVDGLQYEIDSFAKSFETTDFKEGTTAFLEKRKPNYS
ncbi:MAG: enoyl-CoA hydratase [Bacteroidetes bacterium]|nr:MAG: enoyl-CoA hydratase [Bacteroidota bacterium]